MNTIVRILTLMGSGYVLGIATAATIPKGTFSSLPWTCVGVAILLLCARLLFKTFGEEARAQRERGPIDASILRNAREDGLILAITLVVLLLST